MAAQIIRMLHLIAQIGLFWQHTPPVIHREKEGPDKELIKKIVSLTVAVIFIIGLCVVMMYVL